MLSITLALLQRLHTETVAVVVLVGVACMAAYLMLRARKARFRTRVSCLICGRRYRVTQGMVDTGSFTCRCGQQVLLPGHDAPRQRNRS
jgi:hypothetical protein